MNCACEWDGSKVVSFCGAHNDWMRRYGYWNADELLRAIHRNYRALAEARGDEWDRLCDERADLMVKVAAHFANVRAASTAGATLGQRISAGGVMDLVNTNRLRVSVRTARPAYGERAWDWTHGSYRSSDHGKPRRETTWYAHIGGLVVNVKWRPDGKRGAVQT